MFDDLDCGGCFQVTIGVDDELDTADVTLPPTLLPPPLLNRILLRSEDVRNEVSDDAAEDVVDDGKTDVEEVCERVGTRFEM